VRRRQARRRRRQRHPRRDLLDVQTHAAAAALYPGAEGRHPRAVPVVQPVPRARGHDEGGAGTGERLMLEHVKASDPEIYALIAKEHGRQEEGLELIASENFVSEAVLEAAGTI